MSALDFLARAIATLSDHEGRSPWEFDDGASYEESLRRAARRCRGEGLPVRRVMWSSGDAVGSGRRPPWDVEWLDGRWLVPSAGAELVVSVPLRPGGRRSTQPTLQWWATATRAFNAIVAAEGDDARPSRSVRFVVYKEGELIGRRPPWGWHEQSRIHEVELRHGPDGGIRIQAGGFLAAVLAYFASRSDDGDLRWRFSPGAFEIDCRGTNGGRSAARLAVATALWWRLADFQSVFPILAWIVPLTVEACRQAVEAHPFSRRLGSDAVAAYVLETHLNEVHRLSHIFSKAPDAEEEVAGWCREIEAALRQRSHPVSAVPHGLPAGSRPPLSWSSANWGTSPDQAASAYVACKRGELLGHSGPGRHDDRLKTPPARHLAFADGERSLAEIALRLAVECGIEWEAAAQIANRWVREGRINHLHRRLESRTLLYFSYGSCMCRPSFRETVPRFEVIGEAVLRGYRLGFTHRSATRGGGVADIVPAEGGEVRGVLYRIPRVYLRDLDEREGVHTGRYQRQWITVEALGVPFENVLTYAVVNKAIREIPPSPEYAGLIVDGARGLLSERYVAELEAIFEEMGVEPEIPF